MKAGKFWLLALLITLLSMGLQWQGVKGEAVIDDHGWLHDPTTRGCTTNAWDCFQHPQMLYYYRPLIGVSFVFSKRWFQISPQNGGETGSLIRWAQKWLHVSPQNGHDEAFPFHVENLVQHGLLALLAFWLLRLLFRRDRPALIGGILFALHPLHVPVTTFIGGRPDNMALIFLSLYAIGLLKIGGGEEEKEKRRKGEEEKETEKREKGKGNSEESQSTIHNPFNPQPSTLLWLALSLFGFAAAIFTKEQCLLMVLLAPMLLLLHGPLPDARRWWWLGLYAVPIGAYLFLARRVSMTEQLHDPTRTFFSHSLWSVPLHIQMIGRTCWYYVGAFLWPTIDHMHASTLGPWDWAALGPLGRNIPADLPTPPPIWVALGGYLALGFALWLLVRLWRSNPACRFCLLWLLLTLLPCLNIIPVPSQFVAPYRAAIPLFGVCGLLGAGFEAWYERLTLWKQIPDTLVVPVRSCVLLLTLGLICLRFAAVTRADIPWWHDDAALMVAEMRADPNFTPARGGEAYGFSQRNEGAKAAESYTKMLRQMVPEAHTPGEIAQAGLAPDWPRRAASGSSLRYNNIPYLANTLQARGGAYQSISQWNEAAADYRAALAANPADHIIGDWLAYACDHAGLYSEAEAVLKTQIAYFPDSYRLSQLGSLYYRQHRWVEARDTLKKALNAPLSQTGASADFALAQRQYDEAFIRALPVPSKSENTEAN